MTRISYIRTTPEGWEEAIKRMVRLNGLQLSPDEARSILRYLSDHHGLAPEENAKIAYFTEHRIIDEKIPSPEVAHACAACHALAKPLSWHRTPADWQYLENMHIAFFPSVRFTAFDHPHDREPGAAPPKGPTPAGAGTRVHRQELPTPHHGMGGVAGLHAGSQTCRALADLRK